ncbi:hypothetical protein R5R35_011678 [Gryllus longicercus]|uniref:Odorant binding protein n=1 Tax=Gryllus longicercus TaxID=2509291 RepID=A0AAN9VDQ6_9ORTH
MEYYTAVLLAVLFVAVYSGTQRDFLQECKKQFPGAEPKDIQLYSASNDTKCFLHCYFEKKGIMTGHTAHEDTVMKFINPDGRRKFIDENKWRKDVRNCVTISKRDCVCDTAHVYYLCVLESISRNEKVQRNNSTT